ncbi:unnamed protein product [Brassicogethes aeneus]|uniref:Uncharacterized protein n=1 Tax=Brassicogethes aeneus TaxID=1431903 RepID=A0A9P0FBP2_BRAAE|nr:unnamed protein product [Brassicogethes aeneus]
MNLNEPSSELFFMCMFFYQTFKVDFIRGRIGLGHTGSFSDPFLDNASRQRCIPLPARVNYIVAQGQSIWDVPTWTYCGCPMDLLIRSFWDVPTWTYCGFPTDLLIKSISAVPSWTSCGYPPNICLGQYRLAVLKSPNLATLRCFLTAQNRCLLYQRLWMLHLVRHFVILPVDFLYNTGGEKPYEAVKRCLTKTLSDNIGVTYNFEGKRNEKKSFQNLNICQAVITAVKKLLNVTEKEVEMAIKSWLKHCKGRIQNKVQRSAPFGSPWTSYGGPWEIVGHPWEVQLHPYKVNCDPQWDGLWTYKSAPFGSPWTSYGGPWDIVGHPWEVQSIQG